MRLLRRIQDATIDPKFQLAGILRMCQILAAHLDHPAFKEWIRQELNGYEDENKVPDYRILKNLECQGDFFGSFGSGWKNCQIPLYPLPEDFRELVSTKDILQSVSALETVVSQTNESVLRLLWPADYLPILNHYMGDRWRYTCMEAWTLIPTHAYVAVLDTVKSRILDFVIEIEAENPDAGDVEPGVKPIPDKTINYIFNNCILNHPNQSTLSRASIQTNKEIYMSDKNVNNFQGTNFGNIANTVRDSAQQQTNPYIHTEEQKTLAEAAKEIQQLLKQLEQSHPNATEEEKIEYINDETTPSFKRRVINALKATGEAAIDQFVLENKFLKVVKAAIKGWFQPDNSNNK
ncbi:hypothetical protein [Okeania sp. KiyG1]|uniref:AbiTii domain-containing protein n=1 Tax=Okeania sp. KiyG1 TaxID=2720165 RepID=UPI00192131DC|nr:hypothetical protein [Okeania sp. KiyG1]GGA29529.1 hypothetical protein CYANOKiyG1_45980 [Okeania sp. KiyG1]